MSRPSNRQEALKALRASIASGKIIVGAGAGIGLSAKFIEQGGGDLIVIYNSGRYRMAGLYPLHPFLPDPQSSKHHIQAAAPSPA